MQNIKHRAVLKLRCVEFFVQIVLVPMEINIKMANVLKDAASLKTRDCNWSLEFKCGSTSSKAFRLRQQCITVNFEQGREFLVITMGLLSHCDSRRGNAGKTRHHYPG